MTASSRLSRRAFLRNSALFAGGAATLAGCSTPLGTGLAGTSPGEHNLTYWNLLGGGDGGRMIAMEDVYVKDHPDVDLTAVVLSWGNPYYTKVTLATKGDKPPDVAIAHLTRATILAQADLLEPLDEDLLAQYDMTGDNFTPAAWDKAHTNDKLYAIPLDTHAFVMYYNTEVCDKAGLLDADGKLVDLDGPTALVDAMAEAQKVTGEWGGVLSIIGDYATQWRFFTSLYWQLTGGGDLVGDNGTKITMDDDAVEQVLAYIADLTIKRKIMPSAVDYGGTTTMFANGRTGFFFQGNWEVSTFLDAGMKFSMTRLPNVFGGDYACQADSHAFVLPRDASRDTEKRKIIFEFMRALFDQSKTWAEGGHIPAWMPFQTSAAYRKIKPQSDYADVANSVRYDPPGWYTGSGSNFEYIVGSTVAAVAGGQTEPAAAVKQIRTKLTDYANTPSPL